MDTLPKIDMDLAASAWTLREHGREFQTAVADLLDQLERASLEIALNIPALAPAPCCSEARLLVVRIIQMLTQL
jgi:hypothetical protein